MRFRIISVIMLIITNSLTAQVEGERVADKKNLAWEAWGDMQLRASTSEGLLKAASFDLSPIIETINPEIDFYPGKVRVLHDTIFEQVMMILYHQTGITVAKEQSRYSLFFREQNTIMVIDRPDRIDSVKEFLFAIPQNERHINDSKTRNWIRFTDTLREQNIPLESIIRSIGAVILYNINIETPEISREEASKRSNHNMAQDFSLEDTGTILDFAAALGILNDNDAPATATLSGIKIVEHPEPEEYEWAKPEE